MGSRPVGVPTGRRTSSGGDRLPREASVTSLCRSRPRRGRRLVAVDATARGNGLWRRRCVGGDDAGRDQHLVAGPYCGGNESPGMAGQLPPPVVRLVIRAAIAEEGAPGGARATPHEHLLARPDFGSSPTRGP